MKLTRPNPSAAALREDFDRVFDRFFGAPPFGTLMRETEAIWSPSADFSETDTEYIVRVEAPGVAKDDFDVLLDGQTLTVAGRREFEAERSGEDFLWREREQGRFVRSLALPSAVKPERVDAQYHDGVLTIRLAKAQPAPRNRIPVK